MEKLCDLHTHSVFSDGTYTPEELVDAAVARGLAALALTDHNTTAGLDRFLAYGKDKPVALVAGTEITTADHGQELHILGLFLKPEMYRKITAYVAEADALKEQSNLSLAQKLNDHGYRVDYAAIKASTSGKVNRAHFAAALTEAGYVSSRDEAFATLLSPAYGLYEPPKRQDALQTISFLRSLGAVPVWAHPLFHVDFERCEALLPLMKEAGLMGIETVYSLYSEQDAAFCRRMCERYSLLESGGSDFHGKNKPDIALGAGKGNLAVPFRFYTGLANAAGRISDK